MKRGPILKLLILFLLGGLYACEDRMYIESDGGILQTRSLGVVSPEWLVDCARTDYPVQFVNMPEPYAGLNISHWDCFVVEQDDDTCTIISLPMDTVSTKFVSEFFIVRKYDRVNYYIRVLPSALAEAPYKYMYGKVDVNLFVVSPEQTVCYNGFVMNERFHLNLLEDNKILLMSEDTIDGGELPGVVITPGEGKPNPNPDPEPDPLPYPDPDPDPVDPNWPWWSTGGGGDGGSSDGGALAGLAGMFKGGIRMNSSDLELLSNAIKQIENDCTYKGIYEYVSSNYSGNGYVYVGDSINRGVAGMLNGNLYFASSSEITATNLMHEIIHLYQKVCGKDIYDSDNMGLAEFELAFFEDVYISTRLNDEVI